MEKIEALKIKWAKCTPTGVRPIEPERLNKVFKKRISTSMKSSMHYFWASMFLQILVYAMLTHVIVRAWGDTSQLYALTGILLYIPFTVVLLRKFKAMAAARTTDDTTASLVQYATLQHRELVSFFHFKKRYELVLIPLSVAIGSVLTFNIFVPGGAVHNINGVIFTFVSSLASCVYAIVRENRKSFIEPIKNLEAILSEFD